MHMKQKSKIKINEIVGWAVRVLLIISVIESALTKKYLNTFAGTLAFMMTFYPSVLEKKFRVYLPSSLQIIITLFIFASEFLGELHNFYYKFPWWDDMLHLISGSVLGIVGFMFVYFLNKTHIKSTKLSPFFIVFFAFCFAMTMGAFWEIIEFLCDRLFGLNMQKFRLPSEDGLVDTMTDLIVDSIGAFIVSFIGYIYMKGKNKLLRKNIKMDKWFKKQRELEIKEDS